MKKSNGNMNKDDESQNDDLPQVKKEESYQRSLSEKNADNMDQNPFICPGCGETSPKNHGFISIQVSINKSFIAYIYCMDQKKAFCKYCSTLVAGVDYFQKHFQYHILNNFKGLLSKKDFFCCNLKAIPMYINPCDKKYPLDFPEIQEETEKDLLKKNFRIQGEDINSNQRVIYNGGEPIPIFGNKICAVLECKICKRDDLMFSDRVRHVSSHKYNKK